ncbi:hypothetical protein BU16DRAFT_537986 [Lophium mytilinum]|uniref:Uncharacterized protein n=1 Tax=Lophium mytilinum TaxID=390894 RepID=A0A6A6QWL8_9PEZI|nr:hypothetical protein BU16DRAFT_537986 [Lophium mytilinum]
MARRQRKQSRTGGSAGGVPHPQSSNSHLRQQPGFLSDASTGNFFSHGDVTYHHEDYENDLEETHSMLSRLLPYSQNESDVDQPTETKSHRSGCNPKNSHVLASGRANVAHNTSNITAKNPLFNDMELDEDNLYFSAIEDIHDLFHDAPLWKPKEEALPYGRERHPYVVRIRDAVMDVPSAVNSLSPETATSVGQDSHRADDPSVEGRAAKTKKAKKSTGFGARFKPGAVYYHAAAIEAAAHILVDKVVALHECGWSRPSLDPKQLNNTALYQPELSFDGRMDAIEKVLKENKGACKWVLDCDDLRVDMLVAGPSKYNQPHQRSKANSKLNGYRQLYLTTGRKKVKKSLPDRDFTEEVVERMSQESANGQTQSVSTGKKRKVDNAGTPDEDVTHGNSRPKRSKKL